MLGIKLPQVCYDSGGGGGGSGGTSTTVQTQQLSPEQKSLLGLVTPTFKSYFNSAGGSNVQPWTGTTLAPQNQLQGLGQSMALQSATGPVQGAVDATLKGTNFLTSGDVLKPGTNPGLQGTLDAATRNLTDTFSRSVLPQVRGDAILAGGYGGNRQDIATDNATKALGQQVGDTTSNILNQNYQSGLDAMAKGLAFAPSNINAAFTPATAVSGIGDVQQNVQQQQINDLIQKYYTQTFFPLQLAEELAGVAFGMPGGSATSSSSISQPHGSTTNNILSGLAGGGSIVASLLPFLMGG